MTSVETRRLNSSLSLVTTATGKTTVSSSSPSSTVASNNSVNHKNYHKNYHTSPLNNRHIVFNELEYNLNHLNRMDYESMAIGSGIDLTTAGNQLLDDFSSVMVKIFYKDRGYDFLVDEHLAAGNLCDLIVVKLELSRSQLVQLKLRLLDECVERIIENWEEVLPLYRQFVDNDCEFRLEPISPIKYEFFDKWNAYFPGEFITLEGDEKGKKRRTYSFGKKSQQKMNDVATQLSCFDKLRITVSSRVRLIFGESGSGVECEASLNTDHGPLICKQCDEQRKYIFNIHRYQYFEPLDATGEGICFIPDPEMNTNITADHTDDEYIVVNVDKQRHRLIWFIASNDVEKQCWLTILRLTKYGLREYRAAYDSLKRRKLTQPSNIDSYVDMDCGKVLLDYTHKDGVRIVDEQIGEHMKRTSSTSSSTSTTSTYRDTRNRSKSESSSSSSTPGTLTPKSCPSESPQRTHQTVIGSVNEMKPPYSIQNPYQHGKTDFDQPWFYSNMSRDEATVILQKYDMLNGVFLVRNSSRDPDSYVLSFMCNHKVMHIQIRQIEIDNSVCLTLDSGATKFYDLQQLVEFYQLNPLLPVKLTHYVVHKRVGQDKLSNEIQ